ncbi:MAG: FAD-dependent monooxygenase [Pseudomonadota bacterium]
MSEETKIPVLIVGGGYAGLSTSLFLAHQGVPSMLVDRHPGIPIQGRARGLNQRSLELFRPLGIERAVIDAGRPFKNDRGVARCTNLAGEWEWLFEPDATLQWAGTSPSDFCLADQSTVEPILIEAARQRGAQHCFGTELLSFDNMDSGVLAVVADCGSGQQRTILADFLVAADGHRSSIREQVQIARPVTAPGQHMANILFDADLSAVIVQRAIFWIVLNQEIGFGALVATSTPGRWSVGVGFDPGREQLADFDQTRCEGIIRAVTGLPELSCTVINVGRWEQTTGMAQHYRKGRVFLVGDSAHVWPPAGAMGANTAIQDAHNLSWKLALHLRGMAGEALLDSYEAERRPVAVALSEFVEKRQKARFSGQVEIDGLDDHTCILGQRYHSDAIINAPSLAVFGQTIARRAEAGARAPHAWLEHQGKRISTLDLFHDAFVLLSEDPAWIAAAEGMANCSGLPVRAFLVGAGAAALIDIELTWRSVYGIAPHSAVLVRPDGYVAWIGGSDDGGGMERLFAVFDQLLNGHRCAI